MNEKWRLLAFLGVVLALSGYLFNEIFLLAYGGWSSPPPGPYPHSGPPIVGTIWLFLIPIGAVFLIISISVEVINRYQRETIDDSWD
jgi:hypothetical protein